jgi:flagellar hook-associated protein 3 FlgL
MRVTFQTSYGGSEYLAISGEQAARARQQVMSGKRVEKAGDDPGAMMRSIEGKSEIAGLDTYERTADTATAKLATLDTTLGAMVDKLSQALVAVTAAQGSVPTATQRDAAAQTLEGIRDALVGDLNTTVRGVYLFGGGAATTPPYARVAGSWTYQGDANPVSVDIGPGQTVDVSVDGQSVAQGSDATNILNELETLIVAVRAGDQVGMNTGSAAITRAFQRATRAQTTVGVDEQAIDERKGQISSSRLGLKARVSADEDADLAMAIAEMSRADTAYTAALGAIGTASRQSLLDYLS